MSFGLQCALALSMIVYGGVTNATAVAGPSRAVTLFVGGTMTLIGMWWLGYLIDIARAV